MIGNGTTYEDLKHEIHERIASEIGRCDYSYNMLASYLGYNSKGAISKLTSFSLDTIPDLPRIVKLANLIDVNVEYLLCVTDERKRFHHDNPVDWSVMEDYTPKRRTAYDVSILFKKIQRKIYLKYHRSKTGKMLYDIQKAAETVTGEKESTKNQHCIGKR